MRLKNYITLNELFDSNVPIKLDFKDDEKDYTWYNYEFKIDKIPYEFASTYNKEDDILDIEFTGDGDFSITNTGNALKVFSAVKKCLIDNLKIMKKENGTIPNSIRFEADVDEPSRVKLYNRFMKVLPKVLKDYKFDKKETVFGTKMYKFSKKGR